MTTIGPASNYVFTSRFRTNEEPGANTAFAEHLLPQSSGPAEVSDRLSDLMDQLETVRRNQLRMSNRDYLVATFTLQEQISAERLAAGQDLETMGVRYEGRVYNIAYEERGRLSPDTVLAADAGIALIAKLRRHGD